jgi:hypothetical protein
MDHNKNHLGLRRIERRGQGLRPGTSIRTGIGGIAVGFAPENGSILKPPSKHEFSADQCPGEGQSWAGGCV